MINDYADFTLGKTPVVRLANCLESTPHVSILAKLESRNPVGSVKDRAAFYVLSKLLQQGKISASTKLIESSSGNFGISLAYFSKCLGLDFYCVIDPNVLPENGRILELFCDHVIKINQRDKNGSYIGTRIKTVKAFLSHHPDAYWVDQYSNPLIVEAYENTIGKELADVILDFDYVFISVGTCGTLAGVSRRIKTLDSTKKVIAVDVEGSIIFGGPPGRRVIPGAGSGLVPENLTRAQVDDHIYVSELEAVSMCHKILKKERLLVGGSSGLVMAGIQKYFQGKTEQKTRVIAIFPDSGERYVSTIFSPDWLASTFGSAALEVTN